MAKLPMRTPVFSRSVDSRSISVARRACSWYASTSRALLGRGQLLDQRVLGRQHDVGHAEDRVDARGEDRDLQVRLPVDRDVELDALGAADPVALHRLDALGPVDLREVQQLVGVLR